MCIAVDIRGSAFASAAKSKTSNLSVYNQGAYTDNSVDVADGLLLKMLLAEYNESKI